MSGYSITTETPAESASKYFGPGIHENVLLSSVEFVSPKKDGTGDPQLIFTFTGKKGETFRHIEWEVGSNSLDPEKARTNLAKRIKHILTKFMPEDKVILSGNSWAEFCKGIISLLGNQHVGKPVAIKLVYNDKDNLGFTKYLGFIATSASELSIGSKERVTKLAATPSTEEEIVTTPVTDNDLGF